MIKNQRSNRFSDYQDRNSAALKAADTVFGKMSKNLAKDHFIFSYKRKSVVNNKEGKWDYVVLHKSNGRV